MIVCVCKNVSDRQIREALAGGADSVRAVRNELGVSTCCGKCAPEVKRMVDDRDALAVVPASLGDSVAQVASRTGNKLRSALYSPAMLPKTLTAAS